ncbi:MupA/Atu3671 family FMN-dependent luciferase-like monooxygenase [Streptantibioticus silvisoli]|uniref:LLM class flavin-dependent oxidoreductase n=1 Tax=Streptantibioticus silvisoli TaxID=2705255 RepID=A0ABT6W650_9ACTN|nr:MupA/Atu3671 family FMN-dependent luciferase-like monooxygenase [Streptantibioticus silvisoli]MDI5965432.1 LLM class flavin-dependent oxidoreductase [Streptantibioticus silvisoli]
MDFSLFYFANDSANDNSGDRYRLLLEGARFADTHGFSAVWTPERHFHAFGGLYPNPSVLGAALAVATERVQIRAGSVVAPLHHPARIAEEWAVVDNLSGGRVGLSFASGWHSTDFALRPEAYQDRRRITLETAQQVRELWRGRPMDVVDGAGTERSISTFPPPVRRELPVWVTSAGNTETFRDAGRAGSGVLTHLLGQDLDQLAEKIAAYRQAVADRPDADGRPGHVALMVHTYLGEDDDTVREAVRAPLSDYLRSSVELTLTSQRSRTGSRRRMDPSKLRREDVDFLVAQSFERYYRHSGLLGTVDKAMDLVDAVRAAGVDEIACLIDFGLPDDAVLAGLEHLDTLRRTVEQRVPAGAVA